MNSYAERIAAFLAVVILSACVAIPEDAPPTKMKDDMSGLASALAKSYLISNVDEFHTRVAKLEECILREQLPSRSRYTPEELDSLTIYLAGAIHTMAMINRITDLEHGRIEKLYDPDTETEEERLFQQFDWAISSCEGVD